MYMITTLPGMQTSRFIQTLRRAGLKVLSLDEWCMDNDVNLKEVLVTGNRAQQAQVTREFVAAAKKMEAFACISSLWLPAGIHLSLSPADYLAASRKGSLTRVVQGVAETVLLRWANGFESSACSYRCIGDIGSSLLLEITENRATLSIGQTSTVQIAWEQSAKKQ